MSSTIKVNNIQNLAGDDSGFDLSTNDVVAVKTANTERMRVDSSGHLLVGKTSASGSTVGAELRSAGTVIATVDGDYPLYLNRKTSDGDIAQFRKDGSLVGNIGINSDRLEFSNSVDSDKAGLSIHNRIAPMKNGSTSDDQVDLGEPSIRFDDIYATNGTIQTSDQNEKNTITDSDLGLDFVNRLAPKSYIFNGKTRTHYGLIAQDVETVLSDISKETSEFAGFIKDDISEEQDGSQYRYGLRYTEFIGILIKALQEADDKIDALTARVTALESE